MKTATGFSVAPERDADWLQESWRETVRSVLITEDRAFYANVLAVVAIAVAVLFLRNPSAYLFPLLMRVLSLTGAHLSYNHLRRQIDTGHSLDPALRILTVMLFFGGMSWAYLLLPSLSKPLDEPLRLVIAAGTITGVGLIVTMTATLRQQTFAFLLGFLLTLFVGLYFFAGDALITYGIGTTALVIGVSMFAFASAQQRSVSADMLVENRRLNEDLADALAQAEFLAKHDPLTGLYNRRALFEYGLVDGQTNPIAHLLLVDLDHFKKINDNYGHDMGDKALIEASKLMRDALRVYGDGHHFAARLGGEEFCVFLDEENPHEALIFAEDLREGLASLHEVLGLPSGATSASIGMGPHTLGSTIDESLRRADAAMYDAKTEGRNRVRQVNR
ncbi:diguanylate cyclase [Erythrobacter aquimaris]|uniref:diguanylate cyclase n=1 Tax=Qipengyuania aquimaris TaxID=255984 RepID=A0A6I4TJD1_9SPHN|nr:GGDEF domain-containing protein [Qipengyuania aquimaris]MXO95906.1 diguanylate cyclase [Qipengyuania aquimaris]